MKDIFAEAATILSDPARWTFATLAKNNRGHCVDPADATAVCWCANGIITAICHNQGVDPQPILRQAYLHSVKKHNCAVSRVNDNMGREAVVELFKELAQ